MISQWLKFPSSMAFVAILTCSISCASSTPTAEDKLVAAATELSDVIALNSISEREAKRQAETLKILVEELPTDDQGFVVSNRTTLLLRNLLNIRSIESEIAPTFIILGPRIKPYVSDLFEIVERETAGGNDRFGATYAGDICLFLSVSVLSSEELGGTACDDLAP